MKDFKLFLGAILLAASVVGLGVMPPAAISGPGAKTGQVGTWSVTGSLNAARVAHTATLLPNGQVLATGGYGGVDAQASAELYNPATGTWTVTGSLNSGRAHHTATMLRNGRVLVTGGISFGPETTIIRSCEVYDPSNGKWAPTGDLGAARYDHSATLLESGQVLVAGGQTTEGLMSSELYDPVSGSWTPTGALPLPRHGHTATLLGGGQVLAAGGTVSGLSSDGPSTGLFDPAQGSWNLTGAMHTERQNTTATLLPNGQVLAVAGWAWIYGSPVLNSSEIYDPVTGIWNLSNYLNYNRYEHTATLLRNGQVLVAAGLGQGNIYLDSAELYDPATETWSVTGSLHNQPHLHTATLLNNGQVLVAGGYGLNGPLASAELYQAPSHNSTTVPIVPLLLD